MKLAACTVLLLVAELTLYSATVSGEELQLKNDVASDDVNTVCPDGSECEGEETCCLMAGGEYGCCPYSDASCCADLLHCCPSGTICDPSTAQCKSNHDDTVLRWQRKRRAIKNRT